MSNLYPKPPSLPAPLKLNVWPESFENQDLTVHLAETVQSPRTFGAHSITEAGYETFDSTQAFIDMFAAFPNGIKVELRPDDIYIVNGVTISNSNIFIDLKGATLIKTSGTGYIFNFSGSLTQKNITIKNGVLKGDNTAFTNGGIAFACDSTSDQIDGLIVENITLENFASYGINHGSVSNFSYKNIAVKNHGSTAVGATIGIGFVIYPKNIQTNGFIDGLYSEINPSSTLTSAAIKFQVCENIQASNIIAKGGTESGISIDSTNNSIYKNIHIADVTSGIGLVLNSNNPIVGITNDSFTVDNSEIDMLGVALSFGDNGCNKIKLTNIRTNGNISAATNATITECELINIKCKNVNLDGTNVSISNSVLQNVLTLNGGILLKGDNNIYDKLIVIDPNANGIKIAGDNNHLITPYVYNSPAGYYPIWIASGTGNRIIDPCFKGVNTILDNGTDTFIKSPLNNQKIYYGLDAPTTGTWSKGDIVYNTNPGGGGYIGWVCTVTGTPGTWKGFGLIAN